METRINIAEILRNKPSGIKLYSPIFGNCTYCYIHDETGDICVKRQYNVMIYFNFEGLYNTTGECLLFPSKEMRDWSKFAWKKGEVLVSNDGKREVLFKTWVNDSYTKFVGFHCLIINDNEEVEYDNGTTVFNTNDFKGIEAENAVQTYINTIEERLGGKLNRETLEVEKTMPELYDGDIAFADYGNRQNVFIVSDKTDLSEGYSSFISLDLRDLTLSMGCRTCFFKKNLYELRLATEEEKQQLFSALEKKGKAWDSDKKAIVDLKPKFDELKPFDKVLGRDKKDEIWEADFFSNYREKSQYPFHCIGFNRKYCIPYNEDTAHLLGTTDDWEGGEG